MTEREEKAFMFWKENPVEWCKTWFNMTPTDYQGDLLNAILMKDKNSLARTAVKSAHGVGKTAILSLAGWHFLQFIPHSRLVATAPTRSQLTDALWPEYAKWQARGPDMMKQMWEVSATHIRHKGEPKTWFGVARTSNKPANMQGFHNDNIMIQVDEASGVPQNVFETIEGALSDAEDVGGTAILVLTGNPNFTMGELYDAFHKNAAVYNRFTITGDPTTKVEESDGRFYVSKRVTQSYRNTMKVKYGDTGAVYDVRVRGKFPSVDDYSVIPLQWAQNAVLVPLPRFDLVNDPFKVVCDVARYGGDETTIGTYRGDHCISLESYSKQSLVKTADLVEEKVRFLRGNRYRVSHIIVDEPGVGGGVIDVLRDRNLVVTPYNGGEALRQDKDTEEDIRTFANRRARDWWHVRRLMEDGLVHIPNDEDLVAQLASVQYQFNDKEKIKIESKKDLKDRLGDLASPDRADNIVMGLAPLNSMAKRTLPDLSSKELEQEFSRARNRPQMDMDLA